MSDSYNFSQQYTIPYATNIQILTGSDFTIDSREKIYLRDDNKINRYVILFYREETAEAQKLKAIQKIFIDISSGQTFEGIKFRVCNLSADPKLRRAFDDVREDQAHPFNWIEKAADPNIFILIYFSGYPQMFYEGPLQKLAFNEFISKHLSTNLRSKLIFQKYNSGNGFIGDSKETYFQQAWGKYVPSGGLDVASALIKTEDIPAGVRVIAEKEYIGPPPGVAVTQLPSRSDTNNPKSIKNSKTNIWTEKINQIYKEDKNNKIVGMLTSGLVKNGGKDSNLISKAFNESIYIDYLVVYTGKKPDEQIKGLARQVYDIAKKIYILKDAYGLTNPEDIAKLAVNMFGFYKFKEKDPSVKVEKANELEALYVSQNVITKLVNVNPVFVQQIAKNVADTILNEEGSLKIAQQIQKYFNDRKGTDKKEITLDEALNIVGYFTDKAEDLINDEDNRNKSDADKKEIKMSADSYDTSSDESFPFKDYSEENMNEQLEKLIDNDNDIKQWIIKRIFDPKNQQQNTQKQSSDNTLGQRRRGGRDIE
jgi:hypothetical protein